MRTRKYFRLCVTLFTAAAFALLVQCAAYAASKADTQKFIDARTSVCWVEGMVLDDLVMGARGKLTFLYVDAKMGEAIRKKGSGSNEGMPDDTAKFLYKYSGKFGDRKGSVMFVLGVEAYKPWDFDTSEISIGGHSLTDGDIAAGPTGVSQTDLQPGLNVLPSGYSGIISFYVPTSHATPGSEIEIAYGEYSTTWKVPGKGE